MLYYMLKKCFILVFNDIILRIAAVLNNQQHQQQEKKLIVHWHFGRKKIIVRQNK